MSASKSWATPSRIEQVIALYKSSEMPTVNQMAKHFKTQRQTLDQILRSHIPAAEFAALKAVRYSRAKIGARNPAFGKTPHNYIGIVDDGNGYLTCIKDGKRQFVHRVVMAESLGLTILPEIFDVHHIDENPHNNNLDNLALTTRRGHLEIHYRQAKDTLSLQLRKSTLWEVMKSTTSR